MKFLREDLEDFETNQQEIGMKYLFRGLSIEAWKVIDVSINECIDYNRIVNQHCTKCYCKCWKDRN